MPSSANTSFTRKKLQMAAQEQEVFARSVLSVNMEQSSQDLLSRQTSSFIRVKSNGAYYVQKSILKPTNSPPKVTTKNVSFTDDLACGMSRSNSLMSAPSEDSLYLLDPEAVTKVRRSPQAISGVMPNSKATTETEQLSVQIGIGIRHGNTLDNYTYCFPAPTATRRFGQSPAEEFSALYCSLWQRDRHCPCFTCARHRRTLRQTPKLGRRGNLPRVPLTTPPNPTSSSSLVDRTNVTISDILVAAGVYTPVSELNYCTQVFEFKERQKRLRIRQVKTLQKASDEHDEREKQVRESIISSTTSASIKPKKNPAQTKSKITSYQAWCYELFQDANGDEDAISLTDAHMTQIEADIVINDNYNKFVDTETEHEWDDEKRSLLPFYNDRATMRQQETLNVYQRSQGQSTPKTTVVTKNKAEGKKQKQRILNPLMHIRLIQAHFKVDREHKEVLTKLRRNHAEQEMELFNEYPDLKPRFHELVGVEGEHTSTSSSQWWSNWVNAIRH